MSEFIKCRICGDTMKHIESVGIITNESYTDVYVQGEESLANIYVCDYCLFAQTTIKLPENHYLSEEGYDTTRRYNNAQRDNIKNYLRMITSNIQNNDLFIDIGCGEGDFLALAKPFFKEVIGIEPSKFASNVLNEKKIKHINDYFSKEHFKDQRTDAFYCSMLLEHLENPLQFLADIYSVSNYDAVGIIVVPNGFDIIRKKLIRHLQVEHINYYSASSLYKLAINSGFSVISIGIPDENNLFIMVKKEGDYPASFAKRKQSIRDFCTTLPQNKVISAWGASHRTATVMRLVEENINIFKWYDSNKNIHGKFIPGCKNNITHPDNNGDVCNNDIILLFGTIFDNQIIDILRNQYHYNGEILTIP